MAAGGFLTEDILITIFTYLPLTSIYKFKAISKDPSELAFVGSSNGLVLCYTTVNHRRSYYVCNPLTQEWVSIPSPPNPIWCHIGVVGFFSEYSSSYTTSCYKVVRIASLSDKVWADIFCSKSGEWNSVDVSCPVSVSMERLRFDTVVTHDAVLYWINEGHKVIACDINNDGFQCRIIDLPDDDGANARDRILGESDGFICYARIKNKTSLSAWVLKEDNWKSLCNGIELRDILVEMDFKKQNANSRWDSAEVVIQVVGFNPVDHDVVLLSYWNYVWEFNIRTRRFEELCCPSLFLSNSTSLMNTPFVLQPMPTILPIRV